MSGFSYATLKDKESLSGNVLEQLNTLADEFAGTTEPSAQGTFRFPTAKHARAFDEEATKLISSQKQDKPSSTSRNFVANTVRVQTSKSKSTPPATLFTAKLLNHKARSAVLPLVKKHDGFVNGDYAEGFIFRMPEQRDAFIEEANELINNFPAQENVRPQPKKSKREQISEKLKVDTHPNIKRWLEERMRIFAHTDTEGKEALDELNSMLARDFTDEELDDMEQHLAPKPPEPAKSKSLSRAELENKVLGLIPTDGFISDEDILMADYDLDTGDLTRALVTLQAKGYIEERASSYKRTPKAPEIISTPSTQSQRQEENRNDTQENVTRQEQPAQEDNRDVFDLLPNEAELNDVESDESTTQSPPRETPQTEPQAQEPIQIEPPKPKPKRSKKAAALHKKFKTDTHPNIGAYLDDLIETAASKEKSDERTNALLEIKTYETREAPTDESLDSIEKQLQEKKDAQQEAERERVARGKERKERRERGRFIDDNETDPQKIKDAFRAKVGELVDLSKFPEFETWIDETSRLFGRSKLSIKSLSERIAELRDKIEDKWLFGVASEMLRFKAEIEAVDKLGKNLYDKTDRTTSQLELIERLEKVVDILSGENKVRNVEEAYRQVKETLYGKAETQSQQPKPKQKRSTSRKNIGAELLEKIKPDNRPHLKSLLDHLIKKAATPEGKVARAYLEKLQEDLKWLEENNLLDVALDNAEENLKWSRERVIGLINRHINRDDISEELKLHLIERAKASEREFFIFNYPPSKYFELRDKIAQMQDKELQAEAEKKFKYFDTNFKKELPAISGLEQLFEQDNANQSTKESTATTETSAPEEKPAQDTESQSDTKYLEPELYSRDKGNIENGRGHMSAHQTAQKFALSIALKTVKSTKTIIL